MRNTSGGLVEVFSVVTRSGGDGHGCAVGVGSSAVVSGGGCGGSGVTWEAVAASPPACSASAWSPLAGELL